MAKGKYYIISTVMLLLVTTSLVYSESQEAQSIERKGPYIFSLRSAERNVCEKLSAEPEKESGRFQDGLRPVSVPLSKLKRELGKKVIYKGRDVVATKGLWYLEYPFDTAISALERIDDFRIYLSRMVGGHTDVDVSEDGVNFQIKKRF